MRQTEVYTLQFDYYQFTGDIIHVSSPEKKASKWSALCNTDLLRP